MRDSHFEFATHIAPTGGVVQQFGPRDAQFPTSYLPHFSPVSQSVIDATVSCDSSIEWLVRLYHALRSHSAETSSTVGPAANECCSKCVRDLLLSILARSSFLGGGRLCDGNGGQNMFVHSAPPGLTSARYSLPGRVTFDDPTRRAPGLLYCWLQESRRWWIPASPREKYG